jgi:hypothetical protein
LILFIAVNFIIFFGYKYLFKIYIHYHMNSFSTLNTSFFISKKRYNSDNDSPIYIRVSVESEQTAIATKRYINSELWSNKSNNELFLQIT